jgi:IS30 family transposase
MKAGHDQTQIVKLLERRKSTISREISCNRGLKGCRPKQACVIATKAYEKSRNWPWLHKVSTSDSLAKGKDYL